MADHRPFDWLCAPLFSHTPITPDHRITQNLRRFFAAEIGPRFTFDRAFMTWMLDNPGRTLGDAVDEWRKRHGHGDG